MYLVVDYADKLLPTTMASVMIILVGDAIIAPTLQARTQSAQSREIIPQRRADDPPYTPEQKQVLNLPQRLMQRFLAPRAQTQSAMNAHFQVRGKAYVY
jgi:hypothetical protein